MDVAVVPALSVKLEPELLLLPQGSSPQQREGKIIITNHTPGPARGTAELALPEGWSMKPDQIAFECQREAESAVVKFTLSIPGDLQPQQARIRATARLDEREFSLAQQTVAYPHIWTRRLYRPAECRIRVLDVEVAQGLSVGYILGTQDLIPAALRDLGVEVDILEQADLAAGDLSQYDCIVAGVRAYAARADLREHNQRLLRYVEDGGVYIVQYNKSYDWDPTDYAPYPAKYLRSDRITVEESPIKILEPEHPLFKSPNRISSRDFEGWVQERGLYFWSEWDPRYRSLLSGHDPGEEPKLGGMLVAEYGKGLYVYTAYAWFRQIPAGVPGAYRLFANLISLPQTRARDK
ncbi:hypothetical protein ACFL34_04090 [Candidatus Sumerlaeota bacterium]